MVRAHVPGVITWVQAATHDETHPPADRAPPGPKRMHHEGKTNKDQGQDGRFPGHSPPQDRGDDAPQTGPCDECIQPAEPAHAGHPARDELWDRFHRRRHDRAGALPVAAAPKGMSPFSHSSPGASRDSLSGRAPRGSRSSSPATARSGGGTPTAVALFASPTDCRYSRYRTSLQVVCDISSYLEVSPWPRPRWPSPCDGRGRPQPRCSAMIGIPRGEIRWADLNPTRGKEQTLELTAPRLPKRSASSGGAIRDRRAH